MKASGNSSDANAPVVDESREECFVIMPITDGDGYVQGHFKHVFDDIIAPACDIAGYKAIRADHVKETNLSLFDVSSG
ncbi:MAG TPA: hypothetical protein VIT00_05255 [Terrimicrobiaceae bacterium]